LKFLLLFFLLSSLFSCQDQPAKLGLRDINIAKEKGPVFFPCPTEGDCVVSFKALAKPKQEIDPIKFQGSRQRTLSAIQSILKSEKNIQIIKNETEYIYFKLVNSPFGLISDGELYLGEKNLVHLRLASRGFHWWMTNNRGAIENIRFRYHQNDF
jgi:uncharacterized protein (DUF1499 family)